jgi:hypothetical protein
MTTLWDAKIATLPKDDAIEMINCVQRTQEIFHNIIYERIKGWFLTHSVDDFENGLDGVEIELIVYVMAWLKDAYSMPEEIARPVSYWYAKNWVEGLRGKVER